jgi:hypothetical protein
MAKFLIVSRISKRGINRPAIQLPTAIGGGFGKRRSYLLPHFNCSDILSYGKYQNNIEQNQRPSGYRISAGAFISVYGARAKEVQRPASRSPESARYGPNGDALPAI